MSIPRDLASIVSRLAAPFLDFLYPPCCLTCGIRIQAEDVLCAECMTELPELVWDGDHSARVRKELHIPLPVSEIRVGYAYEGEGVMRECIHAMKYRGMKSIAFWFGRLLGERIVENSFARGVDGLVPVPLNRIKEVERGYNQSAYLCRGIAFETGVPVHNDLLVRRRYTRSQAAAKLHAEEREKNVRNAFVVRPGRRSGVEGRALIIVDDLVTTGATAGECIRVLHDGGARDVRLIALAMPVGSEFDAAGMEQS